MNLKEATTKASVFDTIYDDSALEQIMMTNPFVKFETSNMAIAGSKYDEVSLIGNTITLPENNTWIPNQGIALGSQSVFDNLDINGSCFATINHTDKLFSHGERSCLTVAPVNSSALGLVNDESYGMHVVSGNDWVDKLDPFYSSSLLGSPMVSMETPSMFGVNPTNEGIIILTEPEINNGLINPTSLPSTEPKYFTDIQGEVLTSQVVNNTQDISELKVTLTSFKQQYTSNMVEVAREFNAQQKVNEDIWNEIQRIDTTIENKNIIAWLFRGMSILSNGGVAIEEVQKVLSSAGS